MHLNILILGPSTDNGQTLYCDKQVYSNLKLETLAAVSQAGQDAATSSWCWKRNLRATTPQHSTSGQGTPAGFPWRVA
jgi:hypothetical protein